MAARSGKNTLFYKRPKYQQTLLHPLFLTSCKDDDDRRLEKQEDILYNQARKLRRDTTFVQSFKQLKALLLFRELKRVHYLIKMKNI